MANSEIFIGNLPRDINVREIKRFLKGYGHIENVSLKHGFCFVQFEDYRDAEVAIYNLDNKILFGRRVSVEKPRNAPRRKVQEGRDSRKNGIDYYGRPKRTEHRLILENLSTRTRWEDLKYVMGQAGEVTYGEAHEERSNEGFVEFATRADMKNALYSLNDTEVNGRFIKLFEDKPCCNENVHRSPVHKKRRSRSRSSSRGRLSNFCSKPTNRSRSVTPEWNEQFSPRSSSRLMSRSPRSSRAVSPTFRKYYDHSETRSPARHNYNPCRARPDSRSRKRSRTHASSDRSCSRSSKRSRFFDRSRSRSASKMFKSRSTRDVRSRSRVSRSRGMSSQSRSPSISRRSRSCSKSR